MLPAFRTRHREILERMGEGLLQFVWRAILTISPYGGQLCRLQLLWHYLYRVRLQHLSF